MQEIFPYARVHTHARRRVWGGSLRSPTRLRVPLATRLTPTPSPLTPLALPAGGGLRAPGIAITRPNAKSRYQSLRAGRRETPKVFR